MAEKKVKVKPCPKCGHVPNQFFDDPTAVAHRLTKNKYGEFCNLFGQYKTEDWNKLAEIVNIKKKCDKKMGF